MKKLKRTMAAVVFGVTVAAVVQELSKPEEEREWHGTVAGFVPYDFRPPTLERLRDSWWNPDSEQLFTDRVFGVGWAINLARVAELIKERQGSST
ncbi:MAG: hypothetical protein GEU71_02340 [Actinobacteria bacterium]|jgi:hypothetical protein|nr:hypothetical protein [Actinomycetota bacterium]